MKLTAKTLFSVLLVFLSIQFVSAQEPAEITIGTRHSMYSKVLQQDRPYSIYLPNDYSENGNPVSVVYLLDGDFHFHHTTGILDFLENQGKIPPMMLVAIPNTDNRTRDLTPPITKNPEDIERFADGGGADKMLSFIETELMPEINSKYNTSEYKVLIGHSFGGIFSVYTLIQRPDLFDAHISISPSMWWDDQALVEGMESMLESRDTLDAYFYMTMGNEGGAMLGGAMKAAALMEENSPEKFEWDFVRMEKETHGSVPHRSTYDGMETIFSSWYNTDLSEIYLAGGWNGINTHYATLSDKFGSQMNPSESDINQLGYNLMGSEHMDKALEIFQENINRYPESYNVYDSYAEGLMNDGNKEKSIKYYKKSLEIYPFNENAVTMLKEMGVSYEKVKSPINLGPEQLQKYVGTYKFNEGLVATVSVEDGIIYLSGPAIPKEELVAFRKDAFGHKSMNAYIRFTYTDGDVNGMEAQMVGGRRMIGSKQQ